MNSYLREITINDKDEIISFCKEVKQFDIENVFEGLSNIKNVDTCDFEDFLHELEQAKDIEKIKPYLVNQTTYILFDSNNRALGGVNIRHKLNDNLLKHGGHIGILIRPSERRKGYATKIISLALEKCKILGIDKVLITCREDNIGSKKAIESNGGIYENSYFDENNNYTYRRYWIEIK